VSILFLESNLDMSLVKKISILILFFACWQTAFAGWVKQDSGTLAWLRSVYFTNQNKGWIVGSRGTFLMTSDGGKNWKQYGRFTEDNILDVYFSDEQNGWLLCERSVYNLAGQSPSYVLKTSDGGVNWEKLNFTESGGRLARIFFDKKGYGFAVGESGAFYAMQDDKKSWKKTVLPVRYLMLGGNFTDDLHGTLVGGGGTILFTEDGGVNWSPATLAGDARTKFSSVFFINQKTGWAAGTQGKIYATINGGKYWREQNSKVKANLTDIVFLNTAEGFAIGEEGRILHTTTAGNVWDVEEINLKHKLERIFFVGQKGIAVGFGGTILIYDANQTNNKLPAQPQLKNRY
jgi:photosystem II stability/assembly factor-like uncharacterized protein